MSYNKSYNYKEEDELLLQAEIDNSTIGAEGAIAAPTFWKDIIVLKGKKAILPYNKTYRGETLRDEGGKLTVLLLKDDVGMAYKTDMDDN